MSTVPRHFSTNTNATADERKGYLHGPMRSNAMEKIMEVPPIGVDGDVAICDGGGGSLGHPIEYIKLHFTGNNDEGRTELDGICKWCGLRFYDINHPPHGGH